MLSEFIGILKELKIEKLNEEKKVTLEIIIDKALVDCSQCLSVKCKTCPFYEHYNKDTCLYSYFVFKDSEYPLYKFAQEFKNYLNKNMSYWEE